jgi:hypothetical protein
LFWFVNGLKNCGLNMQYINAPNIILGIVNPLNPENPINQVILILKYVLYKCRWVGDKPSINDELKYLKYCIKIEKTTIFCSFSTKKKEYIYSGEAVFGIWNCTAELQNVSLDKLNKLF